MRPQARGMTLLELMVTVALLGVAAALSVTGYQALVTRRRELDAAHALYGAAIKARQLARTTGQPTRVVVVTDAQNVRTLRWERPACAAGGFEPACPSVACVEDVCGEGSCVCDAQGEPIVVPPGLALGGFEETGLCFLGGTGAPRSRGCSGDVPVTEVRLWAPGAPEDVVVTLEPLTGQPRLRSLPHGQPTPGTGDGSPAGGAPGG